MNWQDVVREDARRLGALNTSGYRTPAQEKALGGPASSNHTRGTPDLPGALDFGGTAETLRALFETIKEQFSGRLRELYLNVPGGQSVAIKGDRYLGTNPEAGRAQHLHVSIGPDTPPVLPFIPPNPLNAPNPLNPNDFVQPGALDPAGGSQCYRSVCPPNVDRLWAMLRGQKPPEADCWCWSDIWVYGGALFVIVGGSWLVFWGAKDK